MFTSEHDMRAAGTWDEVAQTQTDTICPYCGVGCELTLHVQDNTIVKVTSPSDHSVTHGNLCIKGRFGFQHVQNHGRSVGNARFACKMTIRNPLLRKPGVIGKNDAYVITGA